MLMLHSTLLFLLCLLSNGTQITAKQSQPSIKRGILLSALGLNPDNRKTEEDVKSPDDVLLIKKSIVHGIPFKNLPEGLFDELVASCERVVYPKDSVIFEEGEGDADFLIIVKEGKCKILIEGQQLPEPYGTAGPGTIIGELALLYGSRRAATVIAATPVSAFKLNKEGFSKFAAYVPPEDSKLLKEELAKVDSVLDKVSGRRKRYDGDIIRKFVPTRSWLWRRWFGTVLEHAWKTVIMNITVSLIFSALIRKRAHPTWESGTVPDPKNEIIARLVGLKMVWTYLMSITTFILTFFLSQAYSLWREFYSLARRIQGRMNDFGLLIAAAATRDKDGRYTPEAQALLDDTSSYLRLFHVLMWASYAKSLNVLLTDTGLRRMISRGLLSLKQYETLRMLNVGFAGYPYACIMWMITRCLKAQKEGALPDDPVLREQMYLQILQLRSTSASIPDLLAAVIPLAYAHIVQILVDIFIFLSPIALYSELGIWSTPAVALLTIFYSGLLDLSKVLLDPLDNDDFYNESVNMDIPVLIRESNSGSTRWRQGAEHLPFL